MTTIIFDDIIENNNYCTSMHDVFKFINKEDNKNNTLNNISKNEPLFKKNIDTIIFSTINNNDPLKPYHSNELIRTIIHACNAHVPLVLKPDNIWINVICNLSKYINKYSKELQSTFVKHEGTKDSRIFVHTQTIQDLNENDWMNYIEKICDNVQEMLHDDKKDLLIKTYSTTTDRDKLVNCIALINSMNKYIDCDNNFNGNKIYYTPDFNYGVPKITLEGNINDWINLKDNIIAFKCLNETLINKWINAMIPILDEFINAVSNNCNKDFWKKMFVQKGINIGGWIFVFAPFDKNMNYILNDPMTDEIISNITNGFTNTCSCLTSATFVNDEKNEEIYFLSGILTTKINNIFNELSPQSDIIIFKKNKIDKNYILNKYLKHNINEPMVDENKLIMWILFLLNKYNFDIDNNAIEIYEYIFKEISNKKIKESKINIYEYTFCLLKFYKLHNKINEYYNDDIYDEFLGCNV